MRGERKRESICAPIRHPTSVDPRTAANAPHHHDRKG